MLGLRTHPSFQSWVREVGHVDHLLKQMVKKVSWQVYYCMLHILTSWLTHYTIDPHYAICHAISPSPPHLLLTMRHNLKK